MKDLKKEAWDPFGQQINTGKSDRNYWLSPQFFVCRWRLTLKTLPVVAAMVGFRFAVWYGAGVGGWVDPSVFTSFIVLAVFVSAILLQGVVQDFKESEKMPSDLQGAFWSLTSELEKASKYAKIEGEEKSKTIEGGAKFMQDGLNCVVNMFMCVIGTLDMDGQRPDESFQTISEKMRESEVKLFALFRDNKVKPKKIAKPIEIIRKTLGRMYVIQATSYIPQCYTLMDSMVLIVFTLMTTANWPKATAFEYAIAYTVIISFLFSFLWLMVRSLEDPFEYPFHYNMKCFVRSEVQDMALHEEFASVGSIDMSAVTVGFGRHLRGLCKEYNVHINEDAEERQMPKPDMQNETSSRVGKNLRRWNIFAWTLPAVAAMIGFRMAVWYGANVDGWIAPQTFTSFIGLTVFVTSLLLQGLIQDYKESEKMPSDLLNAFQGLTAVIQSAYDTDQIKFKAETKPDIKKSPEPKYMRALKSIERLLLAITCILDSEGDDVADEMFNKATLEIRKAEKDLSVYLIKAKAFDLIASVPKPLATIRNLAGRINVIKKTSYILAGYSLADKMILIVFILMTLSKWPVDTKWTVAISFTVVITFLFTYLAILIRKVEDPFTNPKKNFNTECYELESGGFEQKEHIEGLGCIDMSPVTILFGKQLKDLLKKAQKLQNQSDNPSKETPTKTYEDTSGKEKSQQLSVRSDYFSVKYLLKRWRVAICSLPLVILLVCARIVVWYGIGVGGWMDPTAFTSFIGIVIFVAVILIQGIIQDYKEAEKIPSEMLSAFQGLATSIEVAHEVGMNKDNVQGEITLGSSAAHVEKILVAVLHVVENGEVEAYDYAMTCIQEAEVSLNDDLCRLNAHNGGVSAAIETIAKLTGRLHVIQATSYISDGYALMNLSLCLVFALMTASNWPLNSAMPVAISYTVVITYLYTYLRLLIGDLEDPFEYPKGYCLACYVSGKQLPMDAWNEFQKGGSISSMPILTVTFGRQLQSLMDSEREQQSSKKKFYEENNARSWPPKNLNKDEESLTNKIDKLQKFYGHLRDEERNLTMKSKTITIADIERAAQPNNRSAEKNDVMNPKDILARFRLVLRCIPIVAVTVGMRLAVWYGAGIGGWIDQSVFTSFISLAIFVSAIVMQGLLQDYKEAEKMPSELASAFYALTGAVEVDKRWAQVIKEMSGSSMAVTDSSRHELLQQIKNALLAVFKILELPDDESAPFVFGQAMTIIGQAQTTLAFSFADLEKSVKKEFESADSKLKANGNSMPIYPGAKFDKPFDRLRAVLNRMYAIQKTSYILEGYTLMDLMMAAVAALMTAVNWPRETAASAAMAFTVSITFLFAYLQFLVRELEDPFKYPQNHLSNCLRSGQVETTIWEDHVCAGSVSLDSLTLAFGGKLKSLLSKHSKVDDRNVIDASFMNFFPASLNGLFSAISENSKKMSQQNDQLVYLIQRLRLVLQTIPFVLGMIALRFIVWRAASVSGWIDSSVFSSFVGLVIFVISMLVQGIIADYKEAEKLPCQLAASLQSLICAVSFGCKVSAEEIKEKYATASTIKSTTAETEKGPGTFNGADGSRMMSSDVLDSFVRDSMDLESLAQAVCMFHVQNVLEQSLEVLDERDSAQESDRVFAVALREIQNAENGIFEVFRTEKGYSDGAWDAVGPLIEVRQALGRIYSIKQTSFTLDGYSLCDSMLLAILVLLTLSKWPEDKYLGTAISTTVILSGLFFYMALLIRSLEDPFKYPSSSKGTSGNNAGYCVGLYKSLQQMPITLVPPSSKDNASPFKANSTSVEVGGLVQGKDKGLAPEFGWYAAFNCGSPIDLSVLAHGVGFQVRQLFGKVDSRQSKDVLASVKSWLGKDFFKSAFQYQTKQPQPYSSSPAALNSKINVSSTLVWPVKLDEMADKFLLPLEAAPTQVSMQGSPLETITADHLHPGTSTSPNLPDTCLLIGRA